MIPNQCKQAKIARQQWSRNAVAAKERKRLARPAPEYAPILDPNVPLETWTFTNHQSGDFHVVQVFPTNHKRQFRVLIDGQEWRRKIGYDRLMRAIGKALYRKRT